LGINSDNFLGPLKSSCIPIKIGQIIVNYLPNFLEAKCMGRPYNDINRALELKTGLDNYIAYLTDPARRQSKRLSGGATSSARDLQPGAVKPFSDDSPAFAQVKYSENSRSAIASGLSTRLVTTGTNLNNAVKVSKFKAARVNVKGMSSIPSSVPYVRSKKTRLWYPSYPWTLKAGSPFGALTAEEEYRDGAAAVAAALRTALGGTNPRLLINFGIEVFRP
jgi:hypothetical protein